MKLVTFTQGSATRIGIVDGDAIVDLSMAAPNLPRDMCAFLVAGTEALAAAKHAVGSATARVALTEVEQVR